MHGPITTHDILPIEQLAASQASLRHQVSAYLLGCLLSSQYGGEGPVRLVSIAEDYTDAWMASQEARRRQRATPESVDTD